MSSASNGIQAIGGYTRFTMDTDISYYHQRVDGSFVTLTDVTQIAGLLPTAANVRQGTTYNAGGLTGTLAVPAANQVAVGVAVDNTVGTAAITAETIRSALGLASANLDTQLGNIATLADALPTLTEIEASSVLAKSEQITSLQNNAPAEAF